MVCRVQALTGDLLNGTTEGGAITAVVCILLPAEAGRGVGGTVSVLAITTERSEWVLLQFPPVLWIRSDPDFLPRSNPDPD
jgi:hypothetical protein